MFSNEVKLMKLFARKSLMLARGEMMNQNLLRKINRGIKKYSNEGEN